MVPPHCYDSSSTSVTASRLFCSLTYTFSHTPSQASLAHDRLWQLSPFRSLLAHPFAHCSFRLSAVPLHRSLLAAFAFRSLPAHGCFWQRPPFFTASSHTPSQASRTQSLVTAFAFSVFSHTPSHASRTRSLLAAFAFSQTSHAPLCRLLT